MLTGSIVLEDIALSFLAHVGADQQSLVVTYTVTMLANGNPQDIGATETRTVPQADFFSALAIAVHNDGMPDAVRDYPMAESVQPDNPSLRWIP